MKVKCIENTAKNCINLLDDEGYTDLSTFDVEIGKEYVVYSMCLSGRNLLYLLDADGFGRPFWYPAALFNVSDNRIVANWRFTYWGNYGNYEIKAVWGYDELVDDGGAHFDALSERDAHALKVFEKRRVSIEADTTSGDPIS